MKVDVQYYVQKLKEHEANRTSTTERQKFWKEYKEKSNEVK